MKITAKRFKHIHSPSKTFVGDDYLEFLKRLEGPTWITLDGEDPSRSRAIVTLLHGNEPSGLKAIHKLLQAGKKPATNLGIFVVSVEAALLSPLCSHRYLPTEKDFNRCFTGTVNSNQEILANNIITTLKEFSPEAIVDTHNTSAHSDPFAVATSGNLNVRQVTQLFTNKLVVLDLTLGTLIEQQLNCPIVTIEFGGFLDPRSDQLAIDSISTFASRKRLFDVEAEQLMVLEHSLRLEIQTDCALHYSSSALPGSEITIFNTVDQLNFTRLAAGSRIGWGTQSGLEKLIVTTLNESNVALELFKIDNSFLVTKVPMTIFMATTDAQIASKDCLLYLCLETRAK